MAIASILSDLWREGGKVQKSRMAAMKIQYGASVTSCDVTAEITAKELQKKPRRNRVNVTLIVIITIITIITIIMVIVIMIMINITV